MGVYFWALYSVPWVDLSILSLMQPCPEEILLRKLIESRVFFLLDCDTYFLKRYYFCRTCFSNVEISSDIPKSLNCIENMNLQKKNTFLVMDWFHYTYLYTSFKLISTRIDMK